MPPLEKQTLNINFGQGLDTQSDNKQVELGKFLLLENTVFDFGGQLTKRNGFGSLTNLPSADTNYLTTYDGNLLALGNSMQVYSKDTQQWVTKGTFQDVDLSVYPLVRTTNSQLTVDSAIGSNNAICTVYLDANGDYYYTVSDSISGEIVVEPVALPATSTEPRVFALGSNFLVMYFIQVGPQTHFQYIAINQNTPQNPSAPVTIATDVVSATTGWDGVVANNRIYFAYSGTFGGGSVRAASIDVTLQLQVFVSYTGYNADLVSVTADNTTPTPTLYYTFWQSSDSNAYCFAQSSTSVNIFAPTVTYNGQVVNLTSSAQNLVNKIFYQIENTYSFSSTRSDYIEANTIDFGGTPTVAQTIARSVGIASKSFIVGGEIYLLANYAGQYQPSYFIISEAGAITAKLAYSNGIRYLGQSQLLPQANVEGSIVSIGYLVKTQITPVNKNVNAPSVNGIYSQTGINLATFNFNSGVITSNEIASVINITGGFPWMYDGAKPVELGFFLWPEDMAFTPAGTGGGMKQQEYFYVVTYEWSDAAGNIHRSAPSVPANVKLAPVSGTPVTTTATFSSGSTTLTVASTAGFFIGQEITNTTNPSYFQANTTITAIDVGLGTITISLPTTNAGAGDTIQTVDTFAVQLDIPTLRLTYKTAPNDARIVIYRWSVAQQVFYQVTSVTNPILNDPTVDSITYTDTANDAAIIGNLILYTTGGITENIQAPACTVSTLYKGRYFVVDAENRNSLWYSKTVIESTPVEMSNLQVLFVAPTLGAQGSTGGITALSVMDDKLIIFKRDAIYYLTGDGPDATGANNDFSEPVFITATVGCTEPNSIVFMPDGLMFQSDKGIWLLGRDLSTNYIGYPVASFNNFQVTNAVAVPGTNQVRFTLKNRDNNSVVPMLMYDYFFKQWGTFTGISTVTGTLYENKHTLVDRFGKVYQETPNRYLDGTRPVLLKFTTAWAKFGGLQGFQRMYFFYLLGTFKSPHKLLVNIAYDYDPAVQQQVTITPVNFNGFYGDDPIYGNQSPYGGGSQIEQWRVFLQQQKCQSMQITVQELFDPSYNTVAGEGLTLSGILFVYGYKKGYTTLSPSLSAG